MFCSHCGKSIHQEDISCPHCGAVLGEDRFLGNMYTSSQVRLPVDGLDQAPAGSLSAYTRTDYMSYDNQPEDDVYSNTTYRPLLNEEEDMNQWDDEEEPYDGEESAQESEAVAEAQEQPDWEREEPEEEAEEAPLDVAEDLPEAEDISGADSPANTDSVSPLPKLKPASISPAVQRYMREMDERGIQPRKGGTLKRLAPFLSKQEEPEYDEPAEDIPGMEAEDAPATQSYAKRSKATHTAQSGREDEEFDSVASSVSATNIYSPDDNADDYDDDYDDELGEKRPARFNVDLNALRKNRTIQIAVAAVLVVLVLVGGIRWIGYVTSNLGTKIAGVTHSTYSDGIKLINEYVADAYRADLIQTGAVNADYAKNKLNENMAALNALLPQEPQENDQVFVTTLTIIQEAIGINIMADADAAYQGTTDARAAASQQEWTVIKNAVVSLGNATTVAQLSAIAADVEAGVLPTATPTPVVTATPGPDALYTTLTEGMMDNTAVKKMQSRLAELGYLTSKADGDFGAKTGAAVKAFQEAVGMTADGIATPEMQVALFAADAPIVSVTVTNTPEPEA